MAEPRGIESYVYPCDNDIARLLNNEFVLGALRRIARHFYSNQIQDALARGIIVTRETFPLVSQVIEHCSERIVFPKDVTVVLTTRLRGANALAVENEGKGVVFLSHKAITKLDAPELSFMLGHEFGHIAQGNLSCHMIKGMIDNFKDSSEILGGLLADMIETPLNMWYRCSEFTADRAGLLCCESLAIAESLLRKVIDTEHIMAPSLLELYEDHPLRETRIRELRAFAG